MARELREETQAWWRAEWRNLVLPLSSVAALGLGALLAVFWADEFLMTNSRFRLRLSGTAGEPAGLTILGAKRAPTADIREAFRDDDAKSIYRLPLDERRARLLGIKWVKQATVARRWPNRVEVLLTERTPVAFVHLSRRRNDVAQIALIDEDGVILPVSGRNSYRLPVLLGVREDQPPAQRQARVRIARQFFQEGDGLGLSIADVDVSSLNNLKCRLVEGGRVIQLYLGEENFGGNLRRYLQHREEIARRMPEAAVLDLRLPDRITAAPDHGAGG